jgi:integrase
MEYIRRRDCGVSRGVARTIHLAIASAWPARSALHVIRICRIQLKDGSLSELTKTEAGRRDIPMSPQLRSMLLDWRVRRPRKNSKSERVFPAPGNIRAWPLPRESGGGSLLYGNFRMRFWAPPLKRLGLPAATPHSARHSLISVLQTARLSFGVRFAKRRSVCIGSRVAGRRRMSNAVTMGRNAR